MYINIHIYFHFKFYSKSIYIPLQIDKSLKIHLKGNTLQREPKLVGEVYARQSQIHQAEVGFNINITFLQSSNQSDFRGQSNLSICPNPRRERTFKFYPRDLWIWDIWSEWREDKSWPSNPRWGKTLRCRHLVCSGFTSLRRLSRLLDLSEMMILMTTKMMMMIIIIIIMIQGVFFLTGPPPKISKYRKVNLG